jgi:protein-disulfide isomerase
VSARAKHTDIQRHDEDEQMMARGWSDMARVAATPGDTGAGALPPRTLWRDLRFVRGPLLAIIAACAPAASPAEAEPLTPAQRAEIEEIIKSYLLREPEILRDAANVLDERTRVAEAKAREKVVGDLAGPLYSGVHHAVIGNPFGTITLVEFFDYNCGYCRHALADLARLVKDNPDLRVVLHDLPILSDSSVAAARVADAARRQLDGPKFWEFHQKLMSSHGKVGEAEALAAAKVLGVDMDKLATDAEAAQAEVGIAESERLAKALGLSGTPAYVVGQEVVIGAVGYEKLQAKVASTRKCGKAVC